MGDPHALMDRLTAAQNAHDLEGMLTCFHEDYRSEQPQLPARTFQGIHQVRANWFALPYEERTELMHERSGVLITGDAIFDVLGAGFGRLVGRGADDDIEGHSRVSHQARQQQ